jgi:L-threonylcarbamoyladenylate synthase
VGFATETVYGLGANATNATAVARIYEAKGRPSFNPLIIHVASLADAEPYVEMNEIARQLAAAFWPGPLTLVLPLKPNSGICDLVTAGLSTAAIRVPDHKQANEVLRAAGTPIAAPSANPSGRISATTTKHVVQGLGGRIDAVLDGEPCTVGLESTIISVAPTPTVLRFGGLALRDIEAITGSLFHDTTPAAIAAPGQLSSHYAPRQALRMDAVKTVASELMLGFGEVSCDLNLSPRADLREAAANLFTHLHSLDRLDQPIAVSPIPDHGLGRAINDRLRRAAAPRD